MISRSPSSTALGSGWMFRLTTRRLGRPASRAGSRDLILASCAVERRTSRNMSDSVSNTCFNSPRRALTSYGTRAASLSQLRTTSRARVNPGEWRAQSLRSIPCSSLSRMPRVNAAASPPTAILALLRNPACEPQKLGSQTGEATSDRACRSLATNCCWRGTGNRAHDPQRPALKWSHSTSARTPSTFRRRRTCGGVRPRDSQCPGR